MNIRIFGYVSNVDGRRKSLATGWAVDKQENVFMVYTEALN
jgi:hypothetical protein